MVFGAEGHAQDGPGPLGNGIPRRDPGPSQVVAVDEGVTRTNPGLQEPGRAVVNDGAEPVAIRGSGRFGSKSLSTSKLLLSPCVTIILYYFD